MRFLHDRDKRSAFPFSGAGPDDHAMSTNADLHLRGGVRARVTWPPRPAGRPPLLVLVSGAADHARELAARIPAVVVSVEADAAREALEWGADHAAELGADPGRVVLAGEHRGATEIAALAREARDRGWPRLAHVVLFDPRSTTVDALAALFRIALRRPGATPAGTR
jgi:acetyl esterase/lipase